VKKLREAGVTEVVQNSATKGLDIWRHELVLLTDQVGHQMNKMRFSNSESRRNEGLTRSAGQRSGGAGQRPGGAGARRGERKDRTGQAEHPEAAQAPERKDRKK
jgi:hypothetical protein